MAEPRVVLVTGTSRGLGAELARHFLARGDLVVGCSRSTDVEIEGEGYTHHALDLASEPDVVTLFESIRSTHGRLDAAINNAAVNPARSLVALTPASAAAATFDTNVLGTFLVCREAVKLMMQERRGRIVNVGSMATRHEVAGEAAYTASKAAVVALTRVLAKEVADSGITCNVLAPSALEDGIAASVPRDQLQEVLARNAMRSPDKIADVFAAIDWLLEPAAAGITGQVIYLGGA